MQRHGLIGHFAVRYFILCLAALLTFGWWAAQSFDAALTQSTWEALETAANLAAAEVSPLLPGENRAAADGAAAQGPEKAAAETLARIAQKTRSQITVVLPDGQVLLDSREDAQHMANHAHRPEISAALAGATGTDTRYSETRNEPTWYVAVPLRQEGKIVGAVRAAKSAADSQQIYHDSQRALLEGIIVVGLLGGFIGWRLAVGSSRQIQPLAAAARSLAQGQPMPKLPQSDIFELSALAASLNKIAQQLDEHTLRIGQQGHEQAAVLASMVEGVLAVDSEQRVIMLNSAAAQLIGSTQAELQGRSLQEVLRNTDLRRFVGQALDSPDPIEDDVVLHGEGSRILQVRGAALRDTAGRGMGAVIVLNDVTRYRHLENLRRDFVANVSHELKTPIASIKGFVETLLDGAMAHPDDAQRFLKIIANHAERLNNIIEDLLSLSKIEQSEQAANLPLSPAPLRGVLESAVYNCQPHAATRQIELSLECDASLMAHINPPLLEQAVMNLIDNAIKYSEPGRQVQIAAYATEQEVAVAVRDHGCGIAAEHLPRLFERFYRVDRARSRKLGGTGLGLAIVKHIVQAHQGQVTVRSTPGEGSVFCIHLPVETAAAVSV